MLKSVAAGVVLSRNQNQRWCGFTGVVGEGLQQGEDARVSEGDPQGKRPGDSEDNYKRNQ